MQLDWEIWFDNNISPAIAKWMSNEKQWVVKSSYTLETSNLTDYELYNKAKKYGNVIIVTKDSDLPEIVTKLGSPPKIISLKIGNTRNTVLYNILLQNIEHAIRMLIEFNKDIVEID
jgi:predicted nuclease of predicted toxin-antitoxin system